jgi:hypothetical protein
MIHHNESDGYEILILQISRGDLNTDSSRIKKSVSDGSFVK